MRAAVASELIKIRRSRSLIVTLLVALALSVGLMLVIVVVGGPQLLAQNQSDPEQSPYQVIFFGTSLGVWAFAFFAAGYGAEEFTRGLATYTFTATPRRMVVLAAKSIVVIAVGSVGGLVVSLVIFAISQGTLRANGLPSLSITDPILVRAVLLFTPTQAVVWGLGALWLGLTWRRGPVSALFLFLFSALPIAVAPLLPVTFGETIPRWMPGAAIESIAGLAIPGSEGYLPWPVATLTVLAWLTLVLVITVHRLRTCDL